MSEAVINIGPDWLPTPESINALPGPLRRYIHDLEANSPSDLVMENFELHQNYLGAMALLEEYKMEAEKNCII